MLKNTSLPKEGGDTFVQHEVCRVIAVKILLLRVERDFVFRVLLFFKRLAVTIG